MPTGRRSRLQGKGRKRTTTDQGNEGGTINTQPRLIPASTSFDRGIPGGSLEQEEMVEKRLREGPALNSDQNWFSVLTETTRKKMKTVR
ncbi:unnamed protein product [Choristocarpus tenellus]